MTTMIVEVYDALRAIDVPEDKARAAAQALTQDMTREIGALRTDMGAEFKSVRAEIAALRKDMDAGFAALRKDMDSELKSVRTDIAGLRAEVAVMRWLLGTITALLIAIALKLFLA